MNEVVGRKERVILVQVNKQSGNEERVLYQDKYSGGFQPTTAPSNATTFDTQENATKVASALNTLYQITNQKYEVHVVKEVVDRQYLDTPPEPAENTNREDEDNYRGY